MLISLASQLDPLPASLPCSGLVKVADAVSAAWLGPFDDIRTGWNPFFFLSWSLARRIEQDFEFWQQ